MIWFYLSPLFVLILRQIKSVAKTYDICNNMLTVEIVTLLVSWLSVTLKDKSNLSWGGRVERRCWVNFQRRGILLVWMIVGQGPIALAIGAGGGCLDIFSLIYLFSFLSPSLWETVRYRLKYCLKGPLSPKQPTNQLILVFIATLH